MNRLSNKGQTLTLFVILIPFVIFLGIWVIDIAFARYNENKLNEINKMVVKYGINHITSDPYNDMVNLIINNDNEIDKYNIVINQDENEVSVILEKEVKNVFGQIIGKNIYKVKSNYKAYIKDDKVIIEKEIK